LRSRIADTVAAVERAYWTLDAARREVGVREDAVKLADEQRGETDARVDQGVAAESDRAQPRAELERRRGDMLASHEALSRAENAVKVLILGDTDTDLWTAALSTTADPAVESLSVDLDAWIERALLTRPELRAAQSALERRRLEAFAGA